MDIYEKENLAKQRWDELKPFLNCAEIARLVGITRAAVFYWKIIPKKYVLSISKKTHISPSVLRPDLNWEGVDDD